MNKFYIYIYFPTGLDNHINDLEQIEAFVKNLQITLDRVDCEKSTSIYYSQSNKETFVEEVQIIAGMVEYYAILDFEEVLNYFLYNAQAKNWEQNPIHEVNEEFVYYMHWISLNRAVGEPLPSSLKEIAEKKFQIRNHPNKKCLLLNVLHFFKASNPISIIKGSYEDDPIMLSIEFVTNFKELDDWLLANREKRNFNMNDYRHIENNPAYKKEKSPLLGGIGGRENAALLLQNAIGDPHNAKYLINFDKNYNCHIRFEHENDIPQNLYHGYHLVKPISHEIDENEVNKIPERILAIIKYRDQFQ